MKFYAEIRLGISHRSRVRDETPAEEVKELLLPQLDFSDGDWAGSAK